MPSMLEPPTRSSQPLYRQVESHLRDLLDSGALRTGDMLPSVKELCEQFGGINHLTVRQAIKNLTEENLVKSVQGRGSFVTDHHATSQHIAIVLPHLDDTIFVRIAKGAQEALEDRGVRSLILNSRGLQQTEAGHLQNFDALPINGAIIFPIAHSDIAEQIFKLKIEGFNFVLVDRYFDDIATPCVVPDNYQGGYDSARHLTAQGRKRVAWMGEMRSTAARLRFQGFQTALNDANVACPQILVKDIEIAPSAPAPYHAATRESVHQAVDELLQLKPAIDAIVCCDDFTALSALKHLQAKKVAVPEKIALIGFDDVPEAALSHPALTTVRQPMIEIGRQAALMLLERLENRKLPIEKKTLPVELLVRETA